MKNEANERQGLSSPADLREEAEKKLSHLEKISAGDGSDETRKLIHELRVHQIELEMQNAQLAQSQAELEESREKYSDLFDFAPVGYLALNEDGLILEANLTISTLLGVERRWMFKSPFQIHVFDADRDLFRAHLLNISTSKKRGRCELRLKTKSGKHFYAQLDSLCIEADGKRSFRIAVTDISERRQAQEDLRKANAMLESRVQDRTAELQKANAELRDMPSRLLASMDEERRRIGMELHDSVGQTVAAIKFWIETALNLRDEGDSEAALTHLEHFIPILQGEIEEIRTIYMSLRPSMLDKQGLLATLWWLCQEFIKAHPRIHLELEMGIREEEIPENLKINIFRIARESLNNAATHSKAEWVDVSLIRNKDFINLTIADDGIGLDLDHFAPSLTSLGMVGMRERAELTGGRFSLESAPGRGLTVRASWPIAG